MGMFVGEEAGSFSRARGWCPGTKASSWKWTVRAKIVTKAAFMGCARYYDAQAPMLELLQRFCGADKMLRYTHGKKTYQRQRQHICTYHTVTISC